MKLKKTVIIIIIFTSFLAGFGTAAGILLSFTPFAKNTVTAVDTIVNLKDFLDPDLVLYDNLTKNSPDNKKIAFVTATDYGMKSGTIWVIDRDGKNIKKGIEFLYPYLVDKNKWPYQHDVMYWENWPVAQPSLVFGAVAFDNKYWFDTWKKLDHDPEVEEVIRNLPVRHPLIWLN